jgi:hypothetical protein
LFFLVVTPIGVMARVMGVDLLGLRRPRTSRTFWVAREDRDRSITRFTEVK